MMFYHWQWQSIFHKVYDCTYELHPFLCGVDLKNAEQRDAAWLVAISTMNLSKIVAA